MAAYDFDPRKTWPFMIMLLVLSIIGVARVALYGSEKAGCRRWCLLAFPIVALIMVGQELRMRGPNPIIISRSGLLEGKAAGTGPTPCHGIRSRKPRSRSGPSLRGNPDQADQRRSVTNLELMLLRAETDPIMQAIRDHAEAATAHMDPESFPSLVVMPSEGGGCPDRRQVLQGFWADSAFL